MSNTKQQIEEMISDFGEDAIRYGEELHTGRVKSDEEIKADSVELLQKQTEIFEAIDRLVTEAVEETELECFVYMEPGRIQDYKNRRDGTFQKDTRFKRAELKSQLSEEQK